MTCQINFVAFSTTQFLYSQHQTSNTLSKGKSSSLWAKSNSVTFLLFLSSSNGKKHKLKIPVNIKKVFIRDSMDLSLFITLIKNKSLKVLEKKKIYNDYKFCSYCKQSYPDMTVKKCLNKGHSYNEVNS